MAKLFIIAGSNGSDKTTSSKPFLPESLGCKEFINADEIARGISPFQPESVAITAGKIMLTRIDEMIVNNKDFAVETTLSSNNIKILIDKCRNKKYQITLVFIFLRSFNLALERIKDRVKNGGHNVNKDIVIRRYYKGIINFFNVYIRLVDYWIIIDNSETKPILIAEGNEDNISIYDKNIYEYMKGLNHGRND